MGVMKDRLMREHDQGWSFVDDALACEECVEEPFLKQWVLQSASEYACSYCGRFSPETPLAVPVNDLFAFINEGLRTEYEDALDWYPYDNEDKTLVGPWSDSGELVNDLELFSNDDLRVAFVDAFSDRMFCPFDPYGQSESEAFMSGWQRFAAHVEHQARDPFLADTAAQPDDGHWSDNGVSVSDVPAYLGEAVHALGLVREVGTAKIFYRARLSSRGEIYQDAAELGTVPADRATAANRMSAAGTAMFYGADDEHTAVVEVYERSRDEEQTAKASVGAFKPSRSLRVIDLSGQISLPSLFEPTARHLREKVRLLEDFAEAIAQPIQKDRFEHIDYAPTQIVTDYFRRVFSTEDALSIDGIMYLSSRNRNHMCYALLVDNKHCVDGEDSPTDGELRLLLAPGAVHVFGPGLAERGAWPSTPSGFPRGQESLALG